MGVSLDEAERETRIRSKILAAFEDDNQAELPAPVYARGLLRNYATYLGLDPTSVLDLFDAQTNVGRGRRATQPAAKLAPVTGEVRTSLRYPPSTPTATPTSCGFGRATNFPVGSGPHSVAVGDFNNDGNLDIVTANHDDGTVSVMLGNGHGSFGSATPFAVGAYPASVAVGDFNNDGKLDIVTANYSNNVRVLLSNGDGTFSPATNFTVDSTPNKVAVADLNHDGDLDIVTSNLGNSNSNVSVLLGNGSGSFSPAFNVGVGVNPQSVAVGGFDGISNADLVVAYASNSTVGVFLSDGEGGFNLDGYYAVGSHPSSVVVGDFNSNDDIVTTNSDNTVSVLLGNGDGSFGTTTNYAVGQGPAAVTVADFNGDGKLDLATANYSDGTISLLLGDGSGSFAPAANFAAGNHPMAVAVGDFNGDGKPDLVTANIADNDVSLLLNTCPLPPTVTPTVTVTGTPPTNTPTPTLTPALCFGTDPLPNGGFEGGNLVDWTIDGHSNDPAIANAQVHSGSYSALVGNVSRPEPLGDSSFYQTIAVPAGTRFLSYWYWPYTTDSIRYDWQDAYVENSSGTILATIMHVGSNAQTWTNVGFNMAPYAGQTVRIKFLVHQDGYGDTTGMYLDDVHLITATACGTPQPTNTPISPTNTPAGPTNTPADVTPTPMLPFTDTNGNTFYPAIQYLYNHGVVNGTDATHYSPAGTSTRGQFAKVVVLGFGLPKYIPPNGPDFHDVPTSYFAYGYIEAGFHAGILGGYDANTCAAHEVAFPCYLPNTPITRGQLTKLVVNAAQYPLFTPTNGQSFSDVPPSNVFFASIETAHVKAVINGYSDHTFRPNNNIRRDEMAQIVYEGVITP